MVKDNIKNAKLYYGLGKSIEEALKFLESYSDAADTKADIIVSDNVMVKCRPYMTKPESECTFEAHEKYIDIHFVVDGDENMGYADISELKKTEVNEEKDMICLEGKGTNIRLGRGDFMITYPQDAHMPCVAYGEPKMCNKLIAKVKI